LPLLVLEAAPDDVVEEFAIPRLTDVGTEDALETTWLVVETVWLLVERADCADVRLVLRDVTVTVVSLTVVEALVASNSVPEETEAVMLAAGVAASVVVRELVDTAVVPAG
jgi:hypothetical protein